MFLKLENAVAVILVFENKYLFQLRDDKKNIFFPNHWGLFGGALEKREKIIDGLNREIYEELSIKLSKSKIKFFTTISFKFNQKILNRYFFVAHMNRNQKSNIKLKEGKKFKFFKSNDLKKKKLVPYDQFAFWLYLNEKKLYV